MLTLYYKPSCAFCRSVLGHAESLNVQFRLKDISADPVLQAELIEQAGTKQVPFLIDTERGQKMHESEEINAYLSEQYPNGTSAGSFGGLKVHKSEEVCDTCQ